MTNTQYTNYKVVSGEDGSLVLHTRFRLTATHLRELENLTGVDAVYREGNYRVNVNPGFLFNRAVVWDDLQRWAASQVKVSIPAEAGKLVRADNSPGTWWIHPYYREMYGNTYKKLEQHNLTVQEGT